LGYVCVREEEDDADDDEVESVSIVLTEGDEAVAEDAETEPSTSSLERPRKTTNQNDGSFILELTRVFEAANGKFFAR
jgi:hypothetical protein